MTEIIFFIQDNGQTNIQTRLFIKEIQLAKIENCRGIKNELISEWYY